MAAGAGGGYEPEAHETGKQTKARAKTQKAGVSVVTTWINGRFDGYWMQSWCLNSVAAGGS